jgi:hypothetical protein
MHRWGVTQGLMLGRGARYQGYISGVKGPSRWKTCHWSPAWRQCFEGYDHRFAGGGVVPGAARCPLLRLQHVVQHLDDANYDWCPLQGGNKIINCDDKPTAVYGVASFCDGGRPDGP